MFRALQVIDHGTLNTLRELLSGYHINMQTENTLSCLVFSFPQNQHVTRTSESKGLSSECHSQSMQPPSQCCRQRAILIAPPVKPMGGKHLHANTNDPVATVSTLWYGILKAQQPQKM